jgi:hypothetical protein
MTTILELGGCLFLKIFNELAAEADTLFAALHQASEGGGDQRSGDPLPGVLDAVLVQALAFQPPFWLFKIRNSLPAPC